MDELMDMMATDESPSQISDKIKDILFAKSAEKIDAFRPHVAASVFEDPFAETDEVETEAELEVEVDDDAEEED
jgi:hypothetical protein